MLITRVTTYSQNIVNNRKISQANLANQPSFHKIKNNSELPNYFSAITLCSNINFKGTNKATSKDVIDLYKDLNPNITPDKYQIEAVKAILNDNSLIVTAPTGTGKTLIAEGAIYNNLKNNNKTFYTTPLKALTNQKYLDFKKEFGKENVGIITGDINENSNAPIILMTTEVYRNMLKNNEDSIYKNALVDVKTVILDEFHYMNDIDRGIIWEESIINSPENIQLISLSATVKNVNIIQKWMQSLTPQKPVTLIDVPTTERHVPLRFFRYAPSKNNPLITLPEEKIQINKLLPLENNPQRVIDAICELSPQNTPNENKLEEGYKILKNIFDETKETTLSVNELANRISTKIRIKFNLALKTALIISNNMSAAKDLPQAYQNIETKIITDKSKKNDKHYDDINKILFAINPALKGNMFDGMPAITFVFSRKGCEIAADKYYQSLMNPRFKAALNSKSKIEKREKIEEIIKKKEAEGKVLGFGFNEKTKKRLLAGIGVHHAGMLPAHKALVEELFQKKLLDVVFATETLAAGINMPAKTTIITSMTKPGKNSTTKGISISEFQQMAGRAGRRRIDDIGYVITMPENDLEIDKCITFAHSTPDSINSKFDILPSDVIEILSSSNGIYDENKIKNFISRSFAAYASGNTEQLTDKYIQNFKTILELLEKTNFVKEIENNQFVISNKAQMLSEIKGINELFLIDLIENGILARFSPLELASTLSAFTVENKYMFSSKYLKEDIQSLESGLSFPLLEILPAVINANKLLDKYPTDKIEKVSMDPAQALYTYEFITAEDEDYSRRWKNILKMMDNDGRLYFEGNFFYSLNTTLDLLKQIDSACSIMLKKGTDTDKAEMYETLAYNAKCAIRLLQIPPLNESFN